MEIVKVYGPYERKQDGRKVVVLRLKNGTLTTKSYARYLYEQENGVIGDENITVDHIDEDLSNDVLDNFQLLSRAENIRKSQGSEVLNFDCPVCGKNFYILARQYRGNQIAKKKAGPFCSRICSGKRNKEIQMSAYPNRQRKST